MERDFMGLNSSQPLPSVKQEITVEGQEVLYASSRSRFMSFSSRASQDNGTKKMLSAATTSSPIIPSSIPNAFHHGPKTSVGEFQNSPLALSNPQSKLNYTGYGQKLTGSSTTQPFLGIPVTITSPVGQVGFTDLWNNKKSLSSPAQMTIFYAGTVSVYNGISPDKAEAIMILAKNGSSLASNMIPTQSQNITFSKDKQVVTKTTVLSSVASRRSVPVPVMTRSAVPQFRKASLARFLEKRKERVMSVSPYSCEKAPQKGITIQTTAFRSS